jgi:hypothetical protein
MKMSLRFTAGVLSVLLMGAVCFAQHYAQTNLLSNTSGVAAVTDPQLVNPWGLSRSSRAARGGFLATRRDLARSTTALRDSFTPRNLRT